MKMEMLWEQLLGKGLEHLILRQGENLEISSMAVGLVRDIPYRIQYQIVCDSNWNLRKMKVLDLLEGKEIGLVRNGDDWLDGAGVVKETLNGCTEVDIMITPFTNTLPIQRWKLVQGDAKKILVVFVSIPYLSLSKLHQRYTCIAQDAISGNYRYENLSSGFTSEIKVDEDGIVVDYPELFKLAWKRTGPD